MLILTNRELEELIDLEVYHPLVVEVVRKRFNGYYLRAAFSFYNNEYQEIGNLLEAEGMAIMACS